MLSVNAQYFNVFLGLLGLWCPSQPPEEGIEICEPWHTTPVCFLSQGDTLVYECCFPFAVKSHFFK